MTQSNHTPGPWRADGCSVKAIDHGAWFPVAGTNCNKRLTLAGREANARLIAAAPELLEALEDLQKQVRAHVKFDVKKHYGLMVADVAAAKAIAKARGTP